LLIIVEMSRSISPFGIGQEFVLRLWKISEKIIKIVRCQHLGFCFHCLFPGTDCAFSDQDSIIGGFRFEVHKNDFKRSENSWVNCVVPHKVMFDLLRIKKMFHLLWLKMACSWAISILKEAIEEVKPAQSFLTTGISFCA
jgi:hypothetical protein